MGQTPVIKSFKSTSGNSNVDSATGCVENIGVERPGRTWVRWWVWVSACVLVACSIASAAGCVETAECNDTVRCPDAQVCYASHCRDVCQTQQECGAAYTCTPCMGDGADSDEGECFGEDLNACVPEE